MNDDELMRQASLGGLRLGPKPWGECTDAEKIERLKDQLTAWIRVCDQLRSHIDTLEGHQHGANGEILVGLREQRLRAAQGACASWNPFA